MPSNPPLYPMLPLKTRLGDNIDALKIPTCYIIDQGEDALKILACSRSRN